MPPRPGPRTIRGKYLTAFLTVCQEASRLALEADRIGIPEKYWLTWLQNEDDIKNIIDHGGGSPEKLVTQELPPRGVYTPQVVWTLSVTRHLERTSEFESIALCNSRDDDAIHSIITRGTMRHDLRCPPSGANSQNFTSYRLYPLYENVIRCECIIRLWLDLVWDTQAPGTVTPAHPTSETKEEYADPLLLHHLEHNTIYHYLQKTLLSPDPLDRARYLDSRGADFNDPAVMAIKRCFRRRNHWLIEVYAMSKRAEGVDPLPALNELRERIANCTYQ
ncbi:hypothetical protein GQ53DRAFT_874160 [Thozetella sp. PMI_491]|nr:hypothetical protein GQ53DRAFT_874160 [Thozetella sp. PMI_491]